MAGSVAGMFLSGGMDPYTWIVKRVWAYNLKANNHLYNKRLQTEDYLTFWDILKTDPTLVTYL